MINICPKCGSKKLEIYGNRFISKDKKCESCDYIIKHKK